MTKGIDRKKDFVNVKPDFKDMGGRTFSLNTNFAGKQGYVTGVSRL
jgi:hypothetical protein